MGRCQNIRYKHAIEKTDMAKVGSLKSLINR